MKGTYIKLEMVDMISHGKSLMIHNKRRIHFLILVKDMDL